ncbi:MAG: hypothetical protein DRP74_02195 [Candidatus Omnitrophota bacterium]|nr:MAG: hypothetical protein DRP74_02195 [Candidatus Omnitrophota bacterium]
MEDIVFKIVMAVWIIFSLFLFAACWQNKDGSTGLVWLWKRKRSVLVFFLVMTLLVSILIMDRKSLNYCPPCKDLSSCLTKEEIAGVYNVIEQLKDYLKEHKRAKKYFNFNEKGVEQCLKEFRR